ncbi:MAG: GntR family transcriptional regulator [Coprobacillus sp.]
MAEKVPLYYAIMEVIKDSIINGVYPIGSFLPTEIELEEQFKVSKITIRKAIELLENDGYVSKKSGKGTTVISNSIFNKLSNGQSFSSILNQQGYQVSKESTRFEYMTLEPQNELFQYFNRKCLQITRCYYLDGEPYIHFTHYLPGDLPIPDIKNQNNFSLYMFLYQHNYSVATFNDDFYVEFPQIEILEVLKLQDGPVLGRKRISYDINNKVVEVSHSRYNTRKHHYQIQYKV